MFVYVLICPYNKYLACFHDTLILKPVLGVLLFGMLPVYIQYLSVTERYSSNRAEMKKSLQLASVLTHIFNLSLTESVIPTCFKETTIVPVPKNAKVTCLYDYHPVAFMSVAMKCFEMLVIAHINTIIPETLDLLHFAYCPNRSTDDAISIPLHTALSHLDKRNTYVRLLSMDYSSAFNAIVHAKLITKLRSLGLNTSP